MELTEGAVITIILGVIVLAVATVAMTVNALFNSLNARSDALGSDMNAVRSDMNALRSDMNARADALMGHMNQKFTELTTRMDAHEKIVGEQLSAIKAAVAAGAEEHRAWQSALRETNERMSEQFDRSNERIDRLMAYLLDQKK